MKDHTPAVIVAGARTPVGRFLGSLASLSAVDLGAHAIRAALDRAGVAADLVDYVIMGQVLTAGAGQNPARQAALIAGIPPTSPAVTVNKVCLSGIAAIALAAQQVRSGECDIVVAGGQESMSQAPHLVKARNGLRYGDATMVDHLAYDGLHDAATDQSMGALTENRNAERDHISRSDQDDYAAESHRRAAHGWKNGLFDAEVAPVSVPTRRGAIEEVRTDEGVRGDTTATQLASLRPAFADRGTITAASASPLSDGAAAVVVMSKDRAEALGLAWLAEIGAHAMVAGPDSTLQHQPAAAIRAACAKEGRAPQSLDLYELNEAFAAVAIASTRELGIDPCQVNPNGGAIAIGHPLGMSGARVVLHTALELQRRGGGSGAAALCGGGGQGEALMIHVPQSR